MRLPRSLVAAPIACAILWAGLYGSAIPADAEQWIGRSVTLGGRKVQCNNAQIMIDRTLPSEGGAGDDLLIGGDGIDTLTGSDVADTLFGGSEAHLVRPMAVVAVDGVLYVADPGAKGVHRFDQPKGEYDLLHAADGGALPSPVGLARGADGDVYVTDSVLAAVFVIRRGARGGAFEARCQTAAADRHRRRAGKRASVCR